MHDPLHSRLSRIRHRVRRLACLGGFSWFIAVSMGVTFLVCLADWIFHIDDPTVRLSLGVCILLTAGVVGWRFWILPLVRPLTDLDLARRIEKRFPQFKDSLSSTVNFMDHKTDARLGSPQLQQHVIDQVRGRFTGVEPRDIIQYRTVWYGASAAVSVCLVVAAVVLLNPASTALALERLVFPFSADDWPRTTRLRILTPEFELIESTPKKPMRVSAGERVSLLVENARGELPSDARLEYQIEDGPVLTEPLEEETRKDHRDRKRHVAETTLHILRGPVRFRAVGGDDTDMTWREIEVVPPPVLERLTVTLTPPDYFTERELSRLPDDFHAVPEGVGDVEGYVGTTVRIEARSAKPLKSAHLRVKDHDARALELSPDRRSFEAHFVIEEAGVYSYWFDLKDLAGFENPDAPRYEVRGLADAVPEVEIEEPATDIKVTATAIVPLRVIAKDDLGLTDVRLHFRRSGDDAEQHRPLSTSDIDGGVEVPYIAELDWSMQDLELVEGMRVEYHAEASDGYQLNPQHVGRSLTRTLIVVSSEEKQAELSARQFDLLDEIERILKKQQAVRDQVGELHIQLETAGQLKDSDLDLLKRIELDQSQVVARLNGPIDGLDQRTRNLLDEMARNEIDDPEMRLRLEQIAEELDFLADSPLPRIERELTRARKTARNRTPDATSQTDALSQAHSDQTTVVESLEEMQRHLSDWSRRRDLTDDLDELIIAQEKIRRDTALTGQQTLTRPLGDLTPQERADLARLAERQQKQADRLDQLRDKLSQAESQSDNQSTAQTLRDAREHLTGQGTGQSTAGEMREAAQSLKRNQVGQAAESQQRILEDLSDLKDILEQKSASDAETLIKKMKQASDDIETLRKKQEELLQKVQQAQQIPDERQRQRELEKLKKEQQQLRREAERLARRLERLTAQSSSDAARRAAQRMQQAEDELGSEQAGQATDQQREALDDLEQAQRDLNQQRQEIEEQLAREMLERMSDQLAAMIERQQAVIDETNRLENERKERGRLSRAQLKSLNNLVEIQRGLRDETDQLAKKVEAAAVFALALRGASRLMERAASRLDERLTDEETIAVETAAKKRFEDLLAALKNDENQANNQNQPPMDSEGNTDSNPPPGEGIPQLAQLKLLVTLQEDIFQRTAELDEIRNREGELTEAQQAELNTLADEQGQLADLTRNLTEALTPEEDAAPEDPLPLE